MIFCCRLIWLNPPFSGSLKQQDTQEEKKLEWGKEVLPEVKYLDEIQTKIFKVFLIAIHSYLYTLQLCLEISISSNSRNLLQFLLYTVKEKGGKPDRKPYLLPYV